MAQSQKRSGTSAYSSLPGVDTLLATDTGKRLISDAGREFVTSVARSVISSLRAAVGAGRIIDESEDRLLRRAEERLESEIELERRSSIGRVINATGVIIHTNLGRSPLSGKAVRAMQEASGYCNLEFDLETGSRGRRGARAELMLAELTGAEEALIVNNCAAAAVLVLTSLGKGGEAIISRGELVEIGGDFRVPDVMKQSGAELVEVGTTNRTKISDYEAAISDRTRLLVKVHRSNYRIVGFTSVPSIGELSQLAGTNGILLYEDAGSGALTDLTRFGLEEEPLIRRSIAEGADVVTFSGDKLLGGPQAGLIVGRAEVMSLVRKNPLYRALRAGKVIYAALEATFEAFRKQNMFEEIPTLRMLSATSESIRARAEAFVEKLGKQGSAPNGIDAQIVAGESVVGGGSAPDAHPESYLIALKHPEKGPDELATILRASQPAVIARVGEGVLLLDLRTVAEAEEGPLLEVLAGICAEARDQTR